MFLKGCQLRCRWCANPESQRFSREILVKAVRCTGCGRCVQACPSRAIRYLPGYGMITDPEKCTQCGCCVDACYQDARVMQGKDYTVEELMKILEKDEAYYQVSGGGITFSGGEPLIYSSFVRACAKDARKRGWSVLVETCGHVPLSHIEETADVTDIIFCDFKHFSSEVHKKLTGQGNEEIIKNIRWLDEHYKGELYLRYPYIPGCNDSTEAIEKFLGFAQELKSVKKVVFLPYHRLGLPKYQGLGRDYEMGDRKSLKINDIRFLKKYEEIYNLNICIQ